MMIPVVDISRREGKIGGAVLELQAVSETELFWAVHMRHELGLHAGDLLLEQHPI